MPTITDNLNLFKPDPGQSGVAAELNGNWDQLDFRFDEAGGHTHDGTPGQGPKVPVTSLATTGTPSATTYLRGDGLWTTGTGGGGGVTDHGALTGLTDDDHPQYANQSRGDTRYTQRSNNLSDVANTTTARTNLGAAATVHTHAGADITTGTVATARLGSGTPNTATFLRGDQTWAIPGAGGSVNLDDLADVLITSPADNQVLTYDAAGTRWVNETPAAGGAVATDPIWDAAGDLAVGSGANTAARLAIGTSGHVLTSTGSSAAWQAPAGGTVPGFVPFLYPQGLSLTSNSSSLISISNAGGAMLVPFLVPAPFVVGSITLRNADTTALRTMEWRLYVETSGGGAVLNEVAGLNGTDSFTATVASNRTVAATTPTSIGPGVYWLAVRATDPTTGWMAGGHATTAANCGMLLMVMQRINSIAALGATLNAVTGGWVKDEKLPAVRLNGRVFGQSTTF